VASRAGNRLFLHIVNTDRTHSQSVELRLASTTIDSATAYQLVDDPMVEISELNSSEVMQTKKESLSLDGKWSFPAAAVTAVEIEMAA
jgi:hypothetical protein